VAAALPDAAPVAYVPLVSRARKQQRHQSGVTFPLINVEAYSQLSTNEALLTTNASNLTYELARATPAGTVGGASSVGCNLFSK
jgi:hypothetical protein